MKKQLTSLLLGLVSLALLSSCNRELVCQDETGTLVPVYNGADMDVKVGDNIWVGRNAGGNLYVEDDNFSAQRMVVIRK